MPSATTAPPKTQVKCGVRIIQIGETAAKTWEVDLLRLVDIIDDLSHGKSSGVFIDDTGSPGPVNNGNLPGNRRTWVGVIVASNHTSKISATVEGFLSRLRTEFGVSELHFTDIYSGNKEFRNVPYETRIGLIADFAKLFQKYDIPILTQSLEPHQTDDWKNAVNLPEQLPFFNFSQPVDLALFLLLARIKIYLRNNVQRFGPSSHVIVDEGWKKAGTALNSTSFFGPEFCGGNVLFTSSEKVLFLQIADFAAFSLNRMQISSMQGEIKKKENDFLIAIQPLTEQFLNLDKQSMKIANEGGRFILSD